MSLDPKTEDEAVIECLKLAEKFGFQIVIMQTKDFKDLMGTENWQESDFKNALYLTSGDVADSVGNSIEKAVRTQNKFIKDFIKRIFTNPKQKLK